MLEPINLLSVYNAKTSLSEVIFKSYLKKNGVITKDSEIDDLCSFVECLYSITQNICLFDSFYFGYEIKQISKEFDLIRFGENFIINVELKRKQTVEKIKKQLVKNQYYLNFLGKKVFNFTYVTEENKVYFLETESSGEQVVKEVSIDFLIKYLHEQDIVEIDNIDKIFRPTNYLVSPFNSTERFIEGEYFLTQQQSEIREHIIGKSKGEEYCFGIEGSSGTGKTLLTYDIAKHYISQNKRVLIIHCGNLNEGHWKLKSEYDWEICAIKDLEQFDLNSYDLVVVDETQRIWQPQFNSLVEAINNSKLFCIFSFDAKQCLADWETTRDIPSQIENRIPSRVFNLTGKIRTNPEVASFIKNLFDLSKKNEKMEYSNIEIQYFTNYNDAGSYATLLSEKKWEIIAYTPSRYNPRKTDVFTRYAEFNTHKVVGQEFNKVATVIDSSFRYNEDKRLVALGKYYYNPVSMLFQMLTRAREEICIIIVDNEVLLKNCLDILGYTSTPSHQELQGKDNKRKVVKINTL